MNAIEATAKALHLPPPGAAIKKEFDEAIAASLDMATTPELISALVVRGQEMQAMAEQLYKNQDILKESSDSFEKATKAAKATIQESASKAEQNLKDVVAASKHGLNAVADAAREDCETVADAAREDCKAITQTTRTECLDRVQALETGCLARVQAAETQCQAAIEASNSRAEAAESEALKCIEAADRAIATADTLGRSFNVLAERINQLEVTFRTLFAGGGHQPVYTPLAPQLATFPPLPPAPPAPAAVIPPAPEPVKDYAPVNGNDNGNGNGKHEGGIKLHFILIGGLHQKDAERIRQKLRQPTNRHVALTVIENTMKEKLPKDADYAIVSGNHDMAHRWRFCQETLGASKCVRLENDSLVSFRNKIEEIYEARFPFKAPANLGSVGGALSQAAQRAG